MIRTPDLKPWRPDPHITNTEISFRKAVTTRKAVVANMEAGLKKMEPAIARLMESCMEEVLSEKRDVPYWCHGTADEIEQNLFTPIQALFRQKVAQGKRG